MFNTYFAYRRINHYVKDEEGVEGKHTVIYHNYCFRGPNKERYIVIVEQYAYDIYVPKFYLKKHKNCAHKFQYLSNLGEANVVIYTVLKILREVMENHPFASIAFRG